MTGGNIRDDEPHGGADYPHSHWYDGDNKNEDFVVKVDDSSEEDDASSEEDDDD